MATTTTTSTSTTPKQFSRDDIRSALLDSHNDLHLVDLPNGMQVEVRAPTLAELNAYQGEAGPNGEQDPLQMAKAIIRHTYMPKTNTKVFDDADLDVVKDLYFAGAIKKLVTTIGKVMSDEEVLDKGVKAAMKSPTPGSSENECDDAG